MVKLKIKADTFMIDGHDCLGFTEDDWNELVVRRLPWCSKIL